MVYNLTGQARFYGLFFHGFQKKPRNLPSPPNGGEKGIKTICQKGLLAMSLHFVSAKVDLEEGLAFLPFIPPDRRPYGPEAGKAKKILSILLILSDNFLARITRISQIEFLTGFTGSFGFFFTISSLRPVGLRP